jgi:hypothetical protein
VTYRLNGISLEDARFGWVVRSRSKPLADLSNVLSSLRRPGRHGAVSPAPGVLDVPTTMLVIETPRAHLRTLEALVRAGGVLDSTYEPGESVVEFVSCSPSGRGGADSIVDLSVVFRVPAASARGALVTTTAAALSAASVAIGGLFPGLSLEVQDAIVRVKGAVLGLQVTDSSGAWFTYAGPVYESQWLRFEAASGRAFLTTTDTWTGGTEVSGAVDFGGPRGTFEIAPSWTTSPAERAGALTVTTSGRGGASVQVRGRAAYLI